MNEKLKQSLDRRLGGMRWGERDQAKVFRQIQRKELQNMKHFKRGTGLMTAAIAMLFIVMGAALALTQPPRTEDPRVASQTAAPAFRPVALATGENDYFTVTIDSTTFNGGELAFTATLHMKAPDECMFFGLGGHVPPGDPNRQPVRVSLNATVQTVAGDLQLVSGQDLDRTPEVLSMTSDTAVIRMSGMPTSTGPEMVMSLQLTWTDPVSGRERTDSIRWTFAGPAQPRIPLLENRYVTVALAERRTEGSEAVVVLEITPARDWYVLGRTDGDKAALQIHIADMAVYNCSSHDELLNMVEHRQPPLAEIAGTVEVTPQGLRCTLRGELPAGQNPLLGYLVLTISPAAEILHESSDLPHYAEVIVPLPD